MPRTQLNSSNISNVQRNDLDVSTVGESVIRKVIAGTNITISSTGADAGTGDVTINASGGGTPTGTKVSALPVATTFGDTDIVPIVQSGSSKSSTGSLLKTYLSPTVNTYTTSQTLIPNSINIFNTTINVVATLPTAIGISGQKITVQKFDATTNIITMATTSSQTIQGSSASSVVFFRRMTLDFVSDGVNWLII